ncbi:cytidylate kinase-like family protein [Limibacter armeniacum]|uniref:cytidylate kinase-like family protein n=1 Tax=Limibacter armeniacum TaxID=466084 RepID=UPI002FE64D11
MKKVLYDYLTDRFKKPAAIGLEKGPLVTISREFGCQAKDIAQILVDELAQKKASLKNPFPWITINKEVLSDVAKELEMDPEFLNRVDTDNQRGIFGTLVFSFSHTYNVVDIKMHRILREVITTYAERGNVVIVGRGGAIFAKDYPDALHVQLQAPIEWRMKQIASSRGISKTEAEKLIKDMDDKRHKFMQYLMGQHHPFTNHIFDIVINRATMSTGGIVQTIMKALECKMINHNNDHHNK